jgi:hypothetical protein
MMRMGPPKASGCWTATYPSSTLTEVPCGPPIKGVTETSPPDYGASDNIVISPSAITSVEGRLTDFFNASGVYSVFTSSNGTTTNRNGAFSLQLNTNSFPIYPPSICANPTGYIPGQPVCAGFLQFIYSQDAANSTGQIWIENVLSKYLTNHPNGCPTGWGPSSLSGDTSCYLGSQSANINSLSLDDASGVALTGTVQNGQDIVSITTFEGGQYMVYMQPSSPLNITGLWTQAQFNVFGENNGAQAIFPEGATMLNETTVEPSPPPPSSVTWPCPKNSFTAETANLAAGSSCILVNPSRISFVQGAAPVISSISPSQGPVTGYTLVDINGAGFSSNAEVFLAGAYTPAFCDSQTHCTIRTPSGPSVGDMDDIRIANVISSDTRTGVFSAATDKDMFKYIAPVPTGSISPASGGVQGGEGAEVVLYNLAIQNNEATIDFNINGQLVPATLNSCGVFESNPSNSVCLITIPPYPGTASSPVSVPVSVSAGALTLGVGSFTYEPVTTPPPPPPPICEACREEGGICVRNICKCQKASPTGNCI